MAINISKALDEVDQQIAETKSDDYDKLAILYLERITHYLADSRIKEARADMQCLLELRSKTKCLMHPLLFNKAHQFLQLELFDDALAYIKSIQAIEPLSMRFDPDHLSLSLANVYLLKFIKTNNSTLLEHAIIYFNHSKNKYKNEALLGLARAHRYMGNHVEALNSLYMMDDHQFKVELALERWLIFIKLEKNNSAKEQRDFLHKKLANAFIRKMRGMLDEGNDWLDSKFPTSLMAHTLSEIVALQGDSRVVENLKLLYKLYNDDEDDQVDPNFELEKELKRFLQTSPFLFKLYLKTVLESDYRDDVIESMKKIYTRSQFSISSNVMGATSSRDSAVKQSIHRYVLYGKNGSQLKRSTNDHDKSDEESVVPEHD